ncbi:hypothetical protein KI387_010092, partial [Taxus chinensis]
SFKGSSNEVGGEENVDVVSMTDVLGVGTGIGSMVEIMGKDGIDVDDGVYE